MRVLVLALTLLLLGGCATTPTHIDDVCAVFDQKGGWFNNWYKAAKRSEQEYGVPVAILMATIYKESGFQAHAKPPRTKLLGFIPWTRPSSAYGYPQALDGTWAWYQRETGHGGAKRDDFGDAVDFVGWYHYQSHVRNGIALNDAYHLYLAYYAGHGGYARGVWKSRPYMQRSARRAQDMASRYAVQLERCGR
ncbi:transglycosylase SLT domain-containing protein [Alloalcanivorax profundimaris]|uniref:transglycosylase SLT domain-containing protein n=1 Tax=Alloalcanivorax profundimaris TaxID=2735259 RepID=UPI00136EBAED|nr:hypothetical protein [Alloalcanivorax profundimaris]MBF1801149.1 hypothetical protein [Alloalcanivorax profundimaris]MBM1142791.1 hypothetical protein [Alcanivorax sp. ZXX171]MCQ6262881.1 hypothetical protein [Alcanivorax sp. MM125-6]